MRRIVAMFLCVLVLGLVPSTAVGSTGTSVPQAPMLEAAAEGRSVEVSTSAGLIAAIRDLQAGDTLVLAPGTYDVERQLGDMSFSGQPGWYLPIWQNGVTIRGAGSSVTTLTSSVQSANGVWASQDFISVWANGVTIEDLSIVGKIDTNKAIEVMGKDFTLRNAKLITNPDGPWIGEEFAEFAGSIYFSPQVSVTGAVGDVGTSRLENVWVESAWLAAPLSSVTTGTITLRDFTLDWVGAAYAPYSYGMMSKNPVIRVEENVDFIVDDTMADVGLQASSRLPLGARLEYRGVPGPVPANVFTAMKTNGSYPTTGSMDIVAPVSDGERASYRWRFPFGTLDASYNTTFLPEVVARNTLETPLRYGLSAIELVFDHQGALPGPGLLEVYVGKSLAGRQYDLRKYGPAGLGAPVQRVTVDANGYIEVTVDTGGQWYLYEHKILNVRFDARGGSAVASQQVEFGSHVTTPAVGPAKRGYRFLGWYADLGYVRAWKFAEDVVTTDTTLYARYRLLPKAALSAPVAPVWMNHTKTYSVYGTLKPRHRAGSYPVRIYRYRLVNGRWKPYGYVKARATNQSVYTKYSAKVRLPYAGKWRLRACAPADSKHSTTWSAKYDYVRVF